MSETKNITARVLHKYDTTENWDALKDVENAFVPDKGELIVYADDDETPKIKIGDSIRALDALPFVSTVKKTEVVPYPYPKSVLTYNAKKQKPQWEYDPNCMFINSEEHQIDAGKKYTTTFNLIEGYCWNDKSTTQYDAQWTINQVYAFNVTEENLNVQLSIDKTSVVIPINSVNYTELGTITATTSPENIVNTSLSDDKKYLTISTVDEYTFDNEKTVSISLFTSETTNFKETTIDLKVLVNAKPSLDSYTWDEIKAICARGEAKSHFDIGDIKEVDLSKLSSWWSPEATLKETTYVYIVGFNHQRAAETPDVPANVDTIHFGGFKKSINNTYYECALYCPQAEQDTMYYNSFADWKSQRLYDWLNNTSSELGTYDDPQCSLIEALSSDDETNINYGLVKNLRRMKKDFQYIEENGDVASCTTYWPIEWDEVVGDFIVVPDVGELFEEDQIDEGMYKPNDYYWDNTLVEQYPYYKTNSVKKHDINTKKSESGVEAGDSVKYWLRSLDKKEETEVYMIVDGSGISSIAWDGYADISPQPAAISPIFCI